MFQGVLRKMITEEGSPIKYFLNLENDFIGSLKRRSSPFFKTRINKNSPNLKAQIITNIEIIYDRRKNCSPDNFFVKSVAEPMTIKYANVPEIS